MHLRARSGMWIGIAGAAVVVACGSLIDPLRSESQKLDGNGGTFETHKGLTLQVPPGALAQGTRLTVETGVGLPGNALTAVEIGPSGTQFATPVTLTFAIPPGTSHP